MSIQVEKLYRQSFWKQVWPADIAITCTMLRDWMFDTSDQLKEFQ